MHLKNSLKNRLKNNNIFNCINTNNLLIIKYVLQL